MATYFLDSSAIVKRYVPERGSAWIIALCNPVHGHELFISQIALIEVVRAISIKAHDKFITFADCDRLINIFRQDSQSAYGVLPLTGSVCAFAGDLCRTHRQLRSYDAVQLASALILRRETLVRRTTPASFVTADHNLTTIATTEGLRIEDPENYP